MHDLLMVLRTLSVYEQGVGRRVLRVGALVNIAPDVARPLIAKGYLQLLTPAAPLFAAATDPPRKPMKATKRSTDDGS